jgi:putative flippase GtrA
MVCSWMYIWISFQYHSDTRWCFRQFHPGERKVLGRIFLVSAFLPWLGLVMSCVILDLIRWIFSIISCVNINIIWFIYSDLNLGIQILVICHSLSILPWDFLFRNWMANSIRTAVRGRVSQSIQLHAISKLLHCARRMAQSHNVAQWNSGDGGGILRQIRKIWIMDLVMICSWCVPT